MYTTSATSLVRAAHDFAKMCHAGQFRKYTGEPYFNHVANVAHAVALIPGHTPEMVAAAYLHDVIEDCGVQRATIERLFGKTVASYVWWCTQVVPLEVGNRACRKDMECTRLMYAPPEVHTIKLADLCDNTKSIVEDDPKFAKVYIKEKQQLVDVALVHGTASLKYVARVQLAQARQILGIEG